VDAVNRILDELGLEPPRLIVINKADIADGEVIFQLEERYGARGVSAISKTGLDELKEQLAAQLQKERLPKLSDGLVPGHTASLGSSS
jgi:GTP-binding protein HflX